MIFHHSKRTVIKTLILALITHKLIALSIILNKSSGPELINILTQLFIFLSSNYICMLFFDFPVSAGVEYDLFIQLLNLSLGFGRAILSPSFKRTKLLQSPDHIPLFLSLILFSCASSTPSSTLWSWRSSGFKVSRLGVACFCVFCSRMLLVTAIYSYY